MAADQPKPAAIAGTRTALIIPLTLPPVFIVPPTAPLYLPPMDMLAVQYGGSIAWLKNTQATRRKIAIVGLG